MIALFAELQINLNDYYELVCQIICFTTSSVQNLTMCVSKVKKADEIEHTKLDFSMYTGNKASKYSCHDIILKDGINCFMIFRDN